ncbi:MAG: D-alanine--D-alanine ligase family protein [Bacteriovoracia bacterium]
MAPIKKIRIAVLYGGRSSEHEISLRSASSVIKNLDPAKYEIIPIGIDKQGKWQLGSLALLQKHAGEALPEVLNQVPVVLPPHPADGAPTLLPIPQAASAPARTESFDVVFPVMHGQYCEDGTIQGFLELADVPYVGAGVLASSVGMDKAVAKRLAEYAGVKVTPYRVLKKAEWQRGAEAFLKEAVQALGYPLFVKPVCQGSSVGVHKVKKWEDLQPALKDAFDYDLKVLLEKGIAAREIEFSVLENPDHGAPPLVSVAGEIIPKHEFYSYEAKYLDDNGAELLIPARLTPEQLKQAQVMAAQAFDALECEGMARVDLFLDRNTGEFYFNEVNTLPGFTSISMYPKLWEASGIPYKELLSKLIDLAISRHERRRALKKDYAPPK